VSGITGIIDYGVGNVGSVRNMLMRSGCNSIVIDSPDAFADVQRIILPGIGHFARGMELLQKGGWVDPIRCVAQAGGTPLLGICLGMQLLTQGSEEGGSEGLGLLDGRVEYFNPDKMDQALPIPHMGWAHVSPDTSSPLFKDMDNSARFYFVHSLHVVLPNPQSAGASYNAKAISTTQYGYPFVSGFQNGNVFGVQFHPEKSHAFGSKLLKNFCEISC
jgi:imidazole glycerol-phosphate synthase subunit HisH